MIGPYFNNTPNINTIYFLPTPSIKSATLTNTACVLLKSST